MATSTASTTIDGRVPRGEAIDELLQRRALGLRRFDQVDDSRQRGVGAPARHRDRQRAVAVDGAGEHFVALALLDRQRFAGDRRLVHVGTAAADDAVERELLAGLDDHQRAGLDQLDADAAIAGCVADQHIGRREIDQLADRLRARSRLCASSHCAAANSDTTIAASSN